MGSPEVHNSGAVWETDSQNIHIRALRTAPVGVNHKVGDGSTPVQTEEPVGNLFRIHFILLFLHRCARPDHILLGTGFALR